MISVVSATQEDGFTVVCLAVAVIMGIESVSNVFLGMAMRLAFDLGLHLDMSSYVSDGSISAVEAELRRMVFWGAYTLDQ